MVPTRGFWDYWYLNVPNLLLAVLIYLLIARCLLSFVLNERNIVMRTLGLVTNPVVTPVAAMTPRVVPGFAVIMFAMMWLYVIRIVLSTATPLIAR